MTYLVEYVSLDGTKTAYDLVNFICRRRPYGLSRTSEIGLMALRRPYEEFKGFDSVSSSETKRRATTTFHHEWHLLGAAYLLPGLSPRE
ncbi:hypothetical protein ACJ72_05489 [Emergomyces africanus]|uniref:Uncharacterized protein n=1 Tax=Emergomyces africanus TaxID=1955775 RepID=A0A1B7NTT1_9EURO|nr:hypothetical protein ACJ72_05489 [Emergomyces africanus]